MTLSSLASATNALSSHRKAGDGSLSACVPQTSAVCNCGHKRILISRYRLVIPFQYFFQGGGETGKWELDITKQGNRQASFKASFTSFFYSGLEIIFGNY